MPSMNELPPSLSPPRKVSAARTLIAGKFSEYVACPVERLRAARAGVSRRDQQVGVGIQMRDLHGVGEAARRLFVADGRDAPVASLLMTELFQLA